MTSYRGHYDEAASMIKDAAGGRVQRRLKRAFFSRRKGGEAKRSTGGGENTKGGRQLSWAIKIENGLFS